MAHHGQELGPHPLLLLQGAMSCRVNTTDSTSPFPVRIGVAFTSTLMDLPSGTARTNSSARNVSGIAQQLGKGQFRQRYLPAIGPTDDQGLQQPLDWLPLVDQPVDHPADLPVASCRPTG